jgi:ATP-dependent Lhr-like helicase
MVWNVHYKMPLVSFPTISDPLALFHPSVREWFARSFASATRPQALGWPAIARGESTLILSPTGSGKTLTAFLWCLDRAMFAPAPEVERRCRVVYISPLKALAVDVEKNLQAPLRGIAQTADERGDSYRIPTISIRTGDTPPAERARFQRQPADILITTPESLYLMLTSNARNALVGVETIIIDEIHSLVPTKRGAHLAISIERLAARCAQAPQRIGLSATQRPLDEVARFLGGAESARRATKTATTRRPNRLRQGFGESRQSSHANSARAAAEGRPLPGKSLTDKKSLTAATDEITDEFAAHGGAIHYRPVTIVDAGAKKTLSIRIEVPVEDMARLTTADEIPSGPKSVGDERPSIWSAIHPRLLELIRSHRSTLIFVNSRRLAERLAGALNELAGETLVRSHHGSIAREQRTEIEDLLKQGGLRALVATSSLELGIDMGAIDLVVQVEAPPSVASGLQRIGRSGHQIDAVSEGVVFPKFRGDLVACAAVARAMHEGAVEATHYPRNPLDIVAQQVVAMTSMDEWRVDDLYAAIRRAAPFAELGRAPFDGVLDMLSGRYPSDEFAELRPRITWDRVGGTVVAREGSKRVAIANGGTIPDRGLFGVFLLGAAPGSARVGELDEEMVFETHVGDTFVLGASSWRVEEITHDRVLVTPAPGEPGKMPFWKGDQVGRPIELGLAIGQLVHDLLRMPDSAAVEQLTRHHALDQQAARNLLQYLRDQKAATRSVPDATTIVVERVRDELGDWRVCLLSPRGGRIHAPWAMAAAARIREQTGVDVETLWADDGFVVRFPDVDQPPDPQLLFPDPDEAQALVVRQLGGTSLFAAKFRENAARSLLLPKRRPGMRAPLWQQRKRSADLLAVAARYGSFPVLLETYRECLRDFFDIAALVETLADVRSRKVQVVTVDSEKPSPFAASLLFSYVASFIYDGDAPLAERRAQALVVDQAQLRELVGDAELRELLDLESMRALERQLQRLDPKYHVRHLDGLHDLLLAIGDLTNEEIRERVASPEIAGGLQTLVTARRAVPITVAGGGRFVAIEDLARYRDGLGIAVPHDLPNELLHQVVDPLGDLALRFARTHAPFTVAEFSARYGLDVSAADRLLKRLAGEGRIIEGEFRPGGSLREFTDPAVLRQLRRRSLAKLRREVEPVDQAVMGRLMTTWQGLVRRRFGSDALLDVIEQLQGAPLPASILETEILPARLESYDPADLDVVMAAGEVGWIGVETLGEHDGRIALYLADHLAKLMPPETPRVVGDGLKAVPRGTPLRASPPEDLSDRERAIVNVLRARGASFFGPLHEAVGAGYPAETVSALWALSWKGLVTNDTFQVVRAFTQATPPSRRNRRRLEPAPFRSRRLVPASAEGRWTLVRAGEGPSSNGGDSRARTAWATALVQQLLARYGVLTREAVISESIPGGFGVCYPILKAMEEAGRLRRGYFIAGLGATQFALPGALDLLRSLKDNSEQPEVVVMAATDPANPYGAALKWNPAGHSEDVKAGRGPTRTVGATVILVDGSLVAYLARGDRQLLTWLPDSEPQRTHAARAIAETLITRARAGGETPRGMLIEEIDGAVPAQHPLAPFLAEAGFLSGALGFQASREREGVKM